MSWVNKERVTPLDDAPIPGVFFLDGDYINRIRHTPWSEHKKRPVVVFPSGAHCGVSLHPIPEHIRVDIFGTLDLPLVDSDSSALAYAQSVAAEHWYLVGTIDAHSFIVTGEAESAIIAYDPVSRWLNNVVYLKDGEAIPYPVSHIWNDKAREVLPADVPPEPVSLRAVACVRYDLFGTDWAWYATGFNGWDTFYGLVVENDIQCTTFSLADLARLRGPFGSCVSYDYDFSPTSLGELKIQHEQLRSLDRSFPTNSVSREDLLHLRPDLALRIAALDTIDIARIASKVGDALSEDYWTALEIVLASYLGVPDTSVDYGEEDI